MLPTKEEMDELALKTVLGFKQALPEDSNGNSNQSISLEMDQRHITIEVETQDGKTWEQTYSLNRLNREANQQATELLKEQEKELKSHAEPQKSQSKEKNQREGSVADTVKNAV